MDIKYPHFVQALRELAPTNKERAAIIGCSERSVIMYLQCEALPHVERLKRIPALDDALSRDLRPQDPVHLVPIPA